MFNGQYGSSTRSYMLRRLSQSFLITARNVLRAIMTGTATMGPAMVPPPPPPPQTIECSVDAERDEVKP